MDVLPVRRKRRASFQENERLSKRLSILNLERSGPKLYVPVEAPSSDAASTPAKRNRSRNATTDESMMQVDDSKHKVYIYNIDDEFSSDSEAEEGKLVFLPDVDKHLRENRIPRQILANDDGALAGMQLIVYSDPKSLSVPEEEDSVHKAIVDARHRLREKQQSELGNDQASGPRHKAIQDRPTDTVHDHTSNTFPYGMHDNMDID